MAQVCRTGKCFEAIRVALLDPCTLLPVPGLMNGYAIGCIVEFSFAKEIEDGEESLIKDDCGRVCARDKRSDQVKFHTFEFKLATPDAEFESLVTGQPLIVDGADSVGVRETADGDASPYLFVEGFERAGDECDAEGNPIYYRHIWPAAQITMPSNEREGIFRLQAVEGQTKDVLTADIGTGPYGDIPAVATTPLSATERVHYIWFTDDVIPDVQCGAIEVPEPPATFSCDDIELITASEGQVSVTGTELDTLAAFMFKIVNFSGDTLVPVYNPARPAGPFADEEAFPNTVTVDSWTATDITVTDDISPPVFPTGTITTVYAYDAAGTLIATCPLDPGVEITAAPTLPFSTEEFLVLGDIDGDRSVWVSSADGLTQSQVTSDPTTIFNRLSITQDRQRFSTIGSEDGGVNDQWYLYDANGTIIFNNTTVNSPSDIDTSHVAVTPSTTPDGTGVVYMSDGNSNIEVADDQGNKSILVSVGAFGPMVSPDGTMIATYFGNGLGVRVHEYATGNLLASSGGLNGTGAGGRLRWSPDSTTVYVVTPDTTDPTDDAVFAFDVSLATFTLLGIIPGSGGTPVESFDITPDGANLIIAVYDSDLTIAKLPTIGGSPTTITPIIPLGTGNALISTSPSGDRAVVTSGAGVVGVNRVSVVDITVGVPTAPLETITFPGDANNLLTAIAWRGTP